MSETDHAAALAAQLRLAAADETLPDGLGVSDAGPDQEPPADAVATDGGEDS